MDGDDGIFVLDSEYGAMTPPVRGGYRLVAAMAAVEQTATLLPSLRNLLRRTIRPLSTP
jgi:hypothetical protein